MRPYALPVLFYFAVTTCGFQAYRVPSGSMTPTILVDDWMYVNKMVYGGRLPLIGRRLPGYGAPARGDVVAFQSPPQVDQPLDPTPLLVKRLVGTPGDTLLMRQGVLYVNGMPERRGPEMRVNPAGDPEERSALFEWQHRAEVHGSRFGEPPADPTHDHWGPLVVPRGHYFMLGDNRYLSKDSRYWGMVPRANLVGRASFVYYSFVPGEESMRPAPAVSDIRWTRLGHRIR